MILIVGAGLSGLLTAYLLKKEGIPFKILEARNRVGGRINTRYSTNKAPLEMGATWFTAQHEDLIRLLEELDIAYFKQSMDNTAFYKASSASPTQLIPIPSQAPSYRISGGTSSLIHALLDKLDKTDVLINQSAKHIKIHKMAVQVKTDKTFEGNAVVLAIPPKLWATNIEFLPPLPTDLMHVAQQTHTWMEDSIKLALTYDKAFWGQDNLPGTFFSNSGPVTELYDHSNHENSKYALCGFLESSLKSLTPKARQETVIQHLKSVFGVEIERFTTYEECVWSKEEHTFIPSDTFLYPHQNNGHPIFRKSYFEDKLFISSAESASKFPGYMNGAVCSANVIAEKIINLQQGV